MGMTEDFEASLQVLRGFDADISSEVNDIKVLNRILTLSILIIFSFCPQLKRHQDTRKIWIIFFCSDINVCIFLLQRSVASTGKRTTIQFAELKRKRYWFPLTVHFLMLMFIALFFLFLKSTTLEAHLLVFLVLIFEYIPSDRDWFAYSPATQWC